MLLYARVYNATFSARLDTSIIKTNIPIDSEIKYSLFGINEHGVKTQGQTKIIINGEAVPFQVVPHTFPIEFDGMVRMPFLYDSVINVKENKIQSCYLRIIKFNINKNIKSKYMFA